MAHRLRRSHNTKRVLYQYRANEVDALQGVKRLESELNSIAAF